MASITASTKHTMKKKAPSVSVGKSSAGTKNNKAAKRGSAPPLKAVTYGSPTALAELKAKDKMERELVVRELFRSVIGQPGSVLNLQVPHAASTTRDRAGSAADLALVAKNIGIPFVLKECAILDEMQRNLFPEGIETFLDRMTLEDDGNAGETSGGGLKASASAVSLTSLAEDTTTVTALNSVGTDTKRGKTTPPNAREGCLLLIRALCQICGKRAEPFVVGAFFSAALDECCSSSSAVREAAQDAAAAIVQLAHPWSFVTVLCPQLLQVLGTTTEWRVKTAALESLAQCSTTAPQQVQKLIPTLIPAITDQVWDTKAQVSKGARTALLAVCNTNTNPDIRKAVPAVVNAICKPAETNKAISELMGTTFVVPVDASTLAILCPILARGLKEKLAIHKRAACLVISNMSKLVEKPEAVAPFGSLLVPELQKVSKNVQFEEIRDEALKALASLTKALGDLYKVSEDSGHADEMEVKKSRVEAEQERIRAEKEEQERKAAELEKKEQEEKKRFKEAMDARRELDRIAAIEAEEKRKAEEVEKEKAKLSTKGSTGKCQGCGLKKCKKSCMFYSPPK